MPVKRTTTTKTQAVEETVQPKQETKKVAPKQVDVSRRVEVINMSQASFYYSAKRGNGYLELGEYLDSDFMTIEDLQIMKNTAKGVFEKGWLFIDDEEAVEYLGLQRYMDKMILPDELDSIFNKSVDEIKTVMESISSSMKENIYLALKQKFQNGSISDVHVIRAIEDSLGVDKNLSILNF